MKNALEVFIVFLRLGLTSFGGPVAHLGYFHNEFVKKKRWISEESYVDLIALCQFLPGPASSQVGMAIGLSRAGVRGAIAAWLAFTLPSAVLLVAFALSSSKLTNLIGVGWLHGLKIVAVAIVAQAVFVMGKKMCTDFLTIAVAVAAAAVALAFPHAGAQVAIVIAAGVIGFLSQKKFVTTPQHSELLVPLDKKLALGCLATFTLLLVLLPLLASQSGSQSLKLIDSFYRVGSMVFGGGHVVLPLLSAEVVQPGWVSAEQFAAGYGAAQAVPGPLFSFAAYLGAVSALPPNRILVAFICLIAIFLPSLLMVIGVLPFWERLKTYPRVRSIFYGVNAGVVGLLAAALYNPIWTSAIFRISDFALAAICFVLLERFKISSLLIVIFGALAGTALTALPEIG